MKIWEMPIIMKKIFNQPSIIIKGKIQIKLFLNFRSVKSINESKESKIR